jgi:RNA polymerase sigma-70 factor (ECF subfamily)
VIASYRPILYRAARGMTGDSATGRELADTLWAELYGIGRTRTSMASDNRRPLLAYFHGRSTLATWLRSVLAQRHVDTIRARQRDEPLNQDDATVDSTARPARGATAQDSPEPADPDLRRYSSAYSQALDDAVQELEPGDRLRLGSYYVQQLTLAEIGRLVGEHEATVSRKLKRVRRSIRQNIERKLRDEHQLTQAEIELCYQYMVDDPSIDLAGMLGP